MPIKLINLRESLYQALKLRRDATFNLFDAISADGGIYKSVISLSESKYFPRQYSSITDAVADGLSHVVWNDIKKITWPLIDCKAKEDFKYHRFVVDATPNPRPFSNCLPQRTIIHTPNPTPGNKPIGVGHQYSVLAYIPPGDSKERKTWISPVDVRRTLPTEKSHELGIEQLVDSIKKLNLQEELCMLIADSAYGTDVCRKLIAAHDNVVHIFRMRNNRVVFKMAKQDESKKTGRTKKYGSKFSLNGCDNNIEPDSYESFSFETKKGKALTIKAQLYEDMIFKGTKDYKASDNPFRLVKYTVIDSNGNAVFKKPLWIAINGKKRRQITIAQGFTNYMDRYDIEHFFRFSKNCLLADKYQTPDCEHEQSWWNLAALAYLQLSMAKEDVAVTPKKWERYLPEFKDKESKLSSPSQTQRGFNKILQEIGTPAKLPVPRGNPLGRAKGDEQQKREKHSTIFKAKAKNNKLTQGLTKTSKKSKPKKTKCNIIDKIINLIKDSSMSYKEVCDQILMAT